MKEKDMIGKEEHKYLTHNFGGLAKKIFQNELKNAQATTDWRYTVETEAICNNIALLFTKSLWFCLHSALSHASSIMSWAASAECEPGYLTNDIQLLGEVLKEKYWMHDIVLIIDSMKSCSETIWVPKAQTFVGHIDHGNEIQECAYGEATEALVFMVVGMTGNWKHPIAYVLQDKCTPPVHAQLIKNCIGVLNFEGFQVLAVVFDGTYTNQGTAKKLGSVMKVLEFQAWFLHPGKPDTNIHMIFDACHMIKLMRNLLGDYKTISHEVNDKCQNIKWLYIEDVNKL